MDIKPQPFYKQLKLLGEGSFGKAFLVENTVEKVKFNNFIFYIFKFNKEISSY